MESITQFTLGAAMGEAVLGKKIGNKAILWGGIAGTIPDLDIFLFPFLDPVGQLTVHRGISHSLLFSFVMAPLFGWLLYKWYSRKGKTTETTYKDWTLLFFICLITHPLLDTFTVYGTQLFLPFSDYRAGLNSIFIADPIYTLPFLLCIIICLFLKRSNAWRSRINFTGITWSCLYLLFTLFNKQEINAQFEKSFAKQNIEVEQFLTGPTPLNNVLWYGVAKTKGGFYQGFRSLWEEKDSPINLVFIPQNKALLKPIENEYVIDRLKWFSNGYYVVREKENGKFPDFKVMKFGVMDIDPNSENYIFTYKFFKEEDGNLSFDQVRTEPEGLTIPVAAKSIWNRMKGLN